MTRAPWWQAVSLRTDVASGHGPIDAGRASLSDAVRGVGPYRDAGYYGDITHPTPDLVELMARIAVRTVAADPYSRTENAVWRLDQGTGAGKSHALVGLWHLARHTMELLGTDIGQCVADAACTLTGGTLLAPELLSSAGANPQVVALGAGGFEARPEAPVLTLRDRFLWTLAGHDRRGVDQFGDTVDASDRQALRDAIEASGRPTLILLDDVGDHLDPSLVSDAARLDENAAFLRCLLTVASEASRCTVVLALPDDSSVSGKADRSGFGSADPGSAVAGSSRVGRPTEINARSAPVSRGSDYAEIVRRRLFEQGPDRQIVAETVTDHLNVMAGLWCDVLAPFDWARPDTFEAAVTRGYPFHPSLVRLAEREWSTRPGFERVRSVLAIFGAVLHAHHLRAEAGRWVPTLIGPGDLSLSDLRVQNAVLSSGLAGDADTIDSFRQIASAEVVAPGAGQALAGDKDEAPVGGFRRFNPMASERLTTALWLYSLSRRLSTRPGATHAELQAATFVPDRRYGPEDAASVLAELDDPVEGLLGLEFLPGRSDQVDRSEPVDSSGRSRRPERRGRASEAGQSGPGRYSFTTRPTISAFIRAQSGSISEIERDAVMAARTWELVRSGPFESVVLVETPPEMQGQSLRQILAGAGIDQARRTRLVVLDPRRFGLLHDLDQATGAAIRAVLGVSDDRLPVAWASSAVIVCMDGRRRAVLRSLAAAYELRRRVSALDGVQADESLAERANWGLKETRDRLDHAIRAAYCHVAFMSEDHDGIQAVKAVRLDGERETGLHGDLVWAALQRAGRATDVDLVEIAVHLRGQRSTDGARALTEVRDAFWRSPRLPLLHSGEPQLRAAVFDAVRAGDFAIIDASGAVQPIGADADIDLGSAELRLVRTNGQPKVVVPNVTGMSVNVAKTLLEGAWLAISVTGSGIIASQVPAAGIQIEPAATVSVTGEIDSEDEADNPASVEEYDLHITADTHLDDGRSRDAVHNLLLDMATAVETDASRLWFSAQVTVGASARHAIERAAAEAGASVSTTWANQRPPLGG